MDYQIWTKSEFGDDWQRTDAGDLEAAKRELLAASKKGLEPILTVEVPFDLQLKVGEPGAEVKRPREKKTEKTEEKTEEATKSEADQDPPE